MCGTPGAAQSHTWAPRRHWEGLSPECHHPVPPPQGGAQGGVREPAEPQLSAPGTAGPQETLKELQEIRLLKIERLYVLLLCFSSIQARVCLAASPRGSELHPTTEALLRQNKPPVVPSPPPVQGGDAGRRRAAGWGARLTGTLLSPAGSKQTGGWWKSGWTSPVQNRQVQKALCSKKSAHIFSSSC